ncbi:hypothetical protein MKQ70_36590 [Chitinophaga sedimenti]|uniref:hypothetical protein n=1 Tax=Chitinophaga sedimenti TaxID=2033606 RepID=UPI0020043677|nr:hypothetical protein [Chitinophaga sedimenti]MCK7560144.1 hypothetical protein [Chitinophaga sedimenti]
MYPRDGHGTPYYFYPGASLSWLFSEALKDKEGFDFLSFGKLRMSYAVTGKGAESWLTGRGNYKYIGNYTFIDETIARYGFDGSQMVDFNLKNENTYEFELGADVRFLDNRLGIDVAYYKKNSKNQILPFSIPVEAGMSSLVVNSGNLQNQGVELLLTANPIRSKDFNWDFTINFTRNKNKVISLAPGVTGYNLDQAFGADMYSVAMPGKEFGTIVTGYAYATYQAKDASGAPVAHANNGQKVLKQNGSYFRSVDYGQGQKELGTMMEKFMASTSQTLRYKNFNLGVQVDAKIGGKMASATHQYGSNGGTLASTLFGRSKEFGGLTRRTFDATGNVTGTFDDGIIPEGVFDNGINIKAPNGTTYDVSGMSYADAVKQGIVEPVSARIYYARLTQWSTGIREYSTFENSWVAVREVSLGYTMPAKTASMMKLNSLRVSLIGRNLGYLYNTTKDGINPEAGFLSNRAGTFAEYGGMPYIRNLGFKIDASF